MAVPISLLDFFRTGRLGPVSLGLTRRRILQLFGEPHNWSYGDSQDQAAIWVYDAIELHFDGNGSLFLIWCDYLDRLSRNGRTIALDPWIFADPSRLTHAYLPVALKAAGLAFTIRRSGDQIAYVTASGAETGGAADEPTVTYLSRMAANE